MTVQKKLSNSLRGWAGAAGFEIWLLWLQAPGPQAPGRACCVSDFLGPFWESRRDARPCSRQGENFLPTHEHRALDYIQRPLSLAKSKPVGLQSPKDSLPPQQPQPRENHQTVILSSLRPTVMGSRRGGHWQRLGGGVQARGAWGHRVPRGGTPSGGRDWVRAQSTVTQSEAVTPGSPPWPSQRPPRSQAWRKTFGGIVEEGLLWPMVTETSRFPAPCPPHP